MLNNNKRARQQEFSAMMVFMSFIGMVGIVIMMMIYKIIG